MYKKVKELKGGETIRFKGGKNALRNINVKICGQDICIYGNSVKTNKLYGGSFPMDLEVFVYND